MVEIAEEEKCKANKKEKAAKKSRLRDEGAINNDQVIAFDGTMGNYPSRIDPTIPISVWVGWGEERGGISPSLQRPSGDIILLSLFPTGNWSPSGIPIPNTKQDKNNRIISMTKTGYNQSHS